MILLPRYKILEPSNMPTFHYFHCCNFIPRYFRLLWGMLQHYTNWCPSVYFCTLQWILHSVARVIHFKWKSDHITFLLLSRFSQTERDNLDSTYLSCLYLRVTWHVTLWHWLFNIQCARLSPTSRIISMYFPIFLWFLSRADT